MQLVGIDHEDLKLQDPQDCEYKNNYDGDWSTASLFILYNQNLCIFLAKPSRSFHYTTSFRKGKRSLFEE